MNQEKPEEKFYDEIRQLIPVNRLSSELQEKLIRRAEITMFPEGNRLFEQDEQEQLFYLLDGEVEVYQGESCIEIISARTEASKQAINKNSSFSAMAKSRAVLLVINRSYVEAMDNYIAEPAVETLEVSEEETNEIIDWLTPLFSLDIFSKIFSAHNYELSHDLASRFESMKVKKGDQIITQNMPGKYFYLIGEGRCEVSQHDYDSGETTIMAELGAGEFFGDEALLSDQKRTTSVTMLTAGHLMKLSREEYDKLIKQASSKNKEESSLATEQKASVDEILEDRMTAIDQRMDQLKSMLSTGNNIAEDWLENKESEFQPIEDLGVLIEARKKIDHIENMPQTNLPNKNVLDQENTDNTSDEEDGDLALLREQLENAQSQIHQENARASNEDDFEDQKSLTLRNVSDELEEIKNRLEERETFELTRRESFEQQLATERKKMHEQLVRFSTGLERQQSRSLEIEEVRQQAALETRQIIAKFKGAHEQYKFRNELNIKNVRTQLQQQVAEVIGKARQAKTEKDQALAELRDVQKQLEELKAQRLSRPEPKENTNTVPEVPLLLDIESIGNEIDKKVDQTINDAKEQFYEVENKKTSIEDEAFLLKVKESPRKTIFDHLEPQDKDADPELTDWIMSGDQSNLDRDDLSEEQKASLERIKKITNQVLEDAFNGQNNRSQ